ncbi:hypothetical protein O181_110992 [Austropuccinia psidii MF-1]|uniref:Uncharacterized protein n=1 Tax=Austropuccinia psidii MF-1 TaxID=1389203 RepID=A0A9Q3K0X7_9BASI|nr:hypothetical protein [Austropuccinia psidii MF-1]
MPYGDPRSSSFIAKEVVHKYSLTISELPEKITPIILDTSESPSLVVTHHTKYMLELPSFPSFEWQGLITFNAYDKDYYDPSKSFSNYLSSEKPCKALVGDCRKLLFFSSVHIPSLNSHYSLLSSRDEVFKEIQDVGGDNSVSSLHLFFGNMDLPISSYDNSLEEFWDEEEEPEEIETVMKVVPSAYHQYLYVFSKVKAETLPPHHACDHHIELEGSLPPFG